VNVDDDKVREIVRETVKVTLNELFMGLGVDVEDPTEVQKDFAFIRNWRENSQALKQHGILTAIGVVVVGALALMWNALKGG